MEKEYAVKIKYDKATNEWVVKRKKGKADLFRHSSLLEIEAFIRLERFGKFD